MNSGLSLTQKALLVLLRTSLMSWIGGAALFVITSIAEQRYPAFDSVTRDHLATIRFPLYYQFGWYCLGIALASSTLLLFTNGPRSRYVVITALTVLSILIALVDYFQVYLPLQALITPPGKARTDQFLVLHDRSRIINEVHLILALLAGLLACWPAAARQYRSQPVS